jgi:hypothetical protein
MEADKKYKYEVAFSFLQGDEAIAYEINDLIQDRFSTFIYSKKQEVLGGTDGEKTFNTVFYDESRVVVVLYRDGWGKTAWTKIEETAIKNRAFNKDWEFLVVINLDTKSTLPTWIPKPYIWLDYEKYKSEGAIAIIDYKVRTNGGENRPETIEDKAKRFGRLKEAAKERDEFLKSNKVFAAANEEVEKIIELLKESKEIIKTNSSFPNFSTNEDPGRFYEFGYNNYLLLFIWQQSYFEMKDRHLEVLIYQKIKKSHLGLPDVETSFHQAIYSYDRDLSQNNIWVNSNNSFNSQDLVFFWVSKFIDFLGAREKNRS